MSDTAGHSKAPIALDPRFDDGTELTDADIRAYLLKNPDFFARHPELSEQLSIPHEHRGSISLVELQSDQLRKKVRQLNYKLNQLIGVAKQNERIYRVYGDLNLQLLRATSMNDVHKHLEHALLDRLGLSSLSLHMFKGPHALPELQRRLLMEKRFKQDDYFFGRLSQHEKQVVFGDGEIAESAALILLGEGPHVGILAVGSASAGHFTPDMDTLLLDQLKQILSNMLPRLLPY